MGSAVASGILAASPETYAMTMPPMTSPVPDFECALISLRAGRIAPLGPDAMASAIRKEALHGRVWIERLGLVGDEHADSRHHGGADKALHLYPSEHYPLWRRELPERAGLFDIGAFGENLSTQGLREADLCLGDVFTLGDAVVQLSQGRQPCAKLNLRFEHGEMLARVFATRRTGVYFRVLVPGESGVGERMRLIERPRPDWPLPRVWDVLFGEPAISEALFALACLPQLSASWRERAVRRLAETGRDISGLAERRL